MEESVKPDTVEQAEDGGESPPPNDYYIRNENPLIRELTVDAQTTLVFYPSGDPNEVVTTTFDEWHALSAERGGFFLGVWVTIESGEVAEVNEQWVP